MDPNKWKCACGQWNMNSKAVCDWCDMPTTDELRKLAANRDEAADALTSVVNVTGLYLMELGLVDRAPWMLSSAAKWWRSFAGGKAALSDDRAAPQG